MPDRLSLDELKHLLLDMLSSSRPVSAARLAALSDDDWVTLSAMIKQHRLAPLLHRKLQLAETGWSVGAATRGEWASAFKRAAMRSMQLRRMLFRISDLLDKASIPYAALKGSWLATHAYPHPAMRPMRDIDILVEKHRAVEAFTLIEAAGFERGADDRSSLAFHLAKTRDMPTLYCRRTGIKFEIHFEICHNPEMFGTADLQSKALLSRAVEVDYGYGNIRYLDPTDMLINLVIHALFDHRLNNGPLLLTDIYYAVEAGDIDWRRFWGLSASAEWGKGARLLLWLTHHYHVQCRLEEEFEIPEPIGKAAALLFLQDFQNAYLLQTRLAITSQRRWHGKLRQLLRKAVTERQVLAQFAGVRADSRFFWLGYPRWAATRIRSYFFEPIGEASAQDLQRLSQVDDWLKSDDR